MYGVFQNIDPPPHRPASVYPPALGSIFWKTSDTALYSTFVSTLWQGGKNWILPKEMNENRFFWDSQWLEIWSKYFCPFMGPNGGRVATL
jgi:hypothetical protein